MSPEASTIPGRLERLSTAPTAPLKPVVSTAGASESDGVVMPVSTGVLVLVSTGMPAVSAGGGVLLAGASTEGLRFSFPPHAAAKTRRAPDIMARSMGHLP